MRLIKYFDGLLVEKKNTHTLFSTLKSMIRFVSSQRTRFAALIDVRHALFTQNNVSEQLFCVNDFVLHLAHCGRTAKVLLAPWLSKKRTSDVVGTVVQVSAAKLSEGGDVELFDSDGRLRDCHACSQTFYASSNVLLSLLFTHSRPGTVLHRLVTQVLLTQAAELSVSVSGADLQALKEEKRTYRAPKRNVTDTNNEQDRSKQAVMRGR
jgi:hypothetical protein